ncbi:hypothetical protein K2173_003441 [Erythroxylum novogranatense]|uniref:WRKY domain-containing protein n=1 Tax=Erythroxylum novogranatense TaxID=1862640 RepID=A0AAV8S8Q2_9ROSI|nr:hypothetical protein K2173_003441 [Erythroxylum novogranatense]
MERPVHWEHKILINELNQGKKLAKLLQNHLNAASSPETREFLVEKILSSYEKSLSMLNWGVLVNHHIPNANLLEVQRSGVNNSLRNEISSEEAFKKRKVEQRWTEQVKVCSGKGLEGPFDDGYSWRKYGQKDILGSKYPRAYYRCTCRRSQGCLAIKQVQRSDEDPAAFEVTYRGRHTCSHVTPSSSAVNDSRRQTKLFRQRQEHQQRQQPDDELSFDVREAVEVKTDDLDINGYIFPSFPLTPIGNENVEENFFGESLIGTSFLDSFSRPFVSPATSDSNHFSPSPNNLNNFGAAHNAQTPESDLNDIISAPASATNSPIGGDLNFSNMDFDPSFLFENL